MEWRVSAERSASGEDLSKERLYVYEEDGEIGAAFVFFIGEYNMLTCDYIVKQIDGDYAHPPMMVSGYKVQLPEKSVLQKKNTGINKYAFDQGIIKRWRSVI